jgi:hypothetical protein
MGFESFQIKRLARLNFRKRPGQGEVSVGRTLLESAKWRVRGQTDRTPSSISLSSPPRYPKG